MDQGCVFEKQPKVFGIGLPADHPNVVDLSFDCSRETWSRFHRESVSGIKFQEVAIFCSRELAGFPIMEHSTNLSKSRGRLGRTLVIIPVTS